MRLWRPYENQWFKTYKALRDEKLYPFQKQLSSCFDVTVGEVIFFSGIAVVSFMAVLVGGGVDGSGSVASVPCAMVFATVPHNSIITLAIGIPFERALRYHIFFAYLAVAGGIWHGLIAVNKEGLFGSGEGVSGVLFEVGMILMLILSFWPIRRRLFDFFYRSHVALFLFSGLIGVAHGAGLMGLAGFVWFLDVVYRYGYLARCKCPTNATITSLPANVVRDNITIFASTPLCTSLLLYAVFYYFPPPC